jgi:hypothetical protein
MPCPVRRKRATKQIRNEVKGLFETRRPVYEPQGSNSGNCALLLGASNSRTANDAKNSKHAAPVILAFSAFNSLYHSR